MVIHNHLTIISFVPDILNKTRHSSLENASFVVTHHAYTSPATALLPLSPMVNHVIYDKHLHPSIAKTKTTDSIVSPGTDSQAADQDHIALMVNTYALCADQAFTMRNIALLSEICPIVKLLFLTRE